MIILTDSEKQQECLGNKESYKPKGIILLTIYLKTIIHVIISINICIDF